MGRGLDIIFTVCAVVLLVWRGQVSLVGCLPVLGLAVRVT